MYFYEEKKMCMMVCSSSNNNGIAAAELERIVYVNFLYDFIKSFNDGTIRFLKFMLLVRLTASGVRCAYMCIAPWW